MPRSKENLKLLKDWFNSTRDYNSGVFLFCKITNKKGTADSLYKYPDKSKLLGYMNDLHDEIRVLVEENNDENIKQPVNDKRFDSVTNFVEQQNKRLLESKKIVELRDKANMHWKIKGDAFAKLKVTVNEQKRILLASEIQDNAISAIRIWNQLDYYDLNGTLPEQEKVINKENLTFEDASKLNKEYFRLSTAIKRLKDKIKKTSDEKEKEALQIKLKNTENEREICRSRLN